MNFLTRPSRRSDMYVIQAGTMQGVHLTPLTTDHLVLPRTASDDRNLHYYTYVPVPVIQKYFTVKNF